MTPDRTVKITGRALLVLVPAVLVVLLVHYEAPALLLLYAGVFFALLLAAASRPIARHTRAPYKAVVFGLVLLVVAGTVAGGALFGATLAREADKLGGELPKAFHAARERLDACGFCKPLTSGLDPASLAKEGAGTGAKGIALGAFGLATALSEVFGVLVVILFVGLYGALDPRAYFRLALTVVPKGRRKRAGQVLHALTRSLTRWLIGRLAAMAFCGVATGLGLWVLHVPAAFGLGVLAGVLAFVEYVGAFASAAPAILLAMTVRPSLAIAVAALFFGVHMVEGYLLTPALARKAVRFPPAMTLALQVLFGSLYGWVGLTFATPIGILLAVLLQKLYVEDWLGDKATKHPPAASRGRPSPVASRAQPSGSPRPQAGREHPVPRAPPSHA